MHKNKKTIKTSGVHLLDCLVYEQARTALHNLIALKSG